MLLFHKKESSVIMSIFFIKKRLFVILYSKSRLYYDKVWLPYGLMARQLCVELLNHKLKTTPFEYMIILMEKLSVVKIQK